jgi:CelD/BcsL family acetyltransferase involved in cellulose biosynthesis
MYRIELATHSRDLLDNLPLWESLAGDNPFRQSAWLRTWWDCFGDESFAYFVVAREENGRIVGILPLHTSRKRPGVLKFIGQGEACSDGLSILCEPSEAETIGREMGHWLTRHSAAPELRWTSIDLDGIVSGDRAMIGLSRGLTEGGAWIDIQSRMHAWFKSTEGTLEEHLAALGRSRRRAARWLIKTLEQATDLTIEVSSSASELRSDLDTMMDLHQRRWNVVGKEGSFASPRFREFVHAAAFEFLQQGRMRMCSLRRNGHIIAGALQLIAGDDSLAIYSTGVDRQHAEIEPGNLLNMHTLQHAYRNLLPGVDYLRGDEPYKSQMMATPRRIARMIVTPATTRGRIQHAAWRGKFEFSQWVRQQRGSEPIAVLPNLELTGCPSLPFATTNGE